VSLLNSRWLSTGYGQWHTRWVGWSVELLVTVEGNHQNCLAAGTSPQTRRVPIDPDPSMLEIGHGHDRCVHWYTVNPRHNCLTNLKKIVLNYRTACNADTV